MNIQSNNIPSNDAASEKSAEVKPAKIPSVPKVSNTFEESMPMLAGILNMYGKSFAKASKLNN